MQLAKILSLIEAASDIHGRRQNSPSGMEAASFDRWRTRRSEFAIEVYRRIRWSDSPLKPMGEFAEVSPLWPMGKFAVAISLAKPLANSLANSLARDYIRRGPNSGASVWLCQAQRKELFELSNSGCCGDFVAYHQLC